MEMGTKSTIQQTTERIKTIIDATRNSELKQSIAVEKLKRIARREQHNIYEEDGSYRAFFRKIMGKRRLLFWEYAVGK